MFGYGSADIMLWFAVSVIQRALMRRSRGGSWDDHVTQISHMTTKVNYFFIFKKNYFF